MFVVESVRELRASSMVGSSLTQLIGLSTKVHRNMLSMVRFARSVWPSVCGWYAVDRD